MQQQNRLGRVPEPSRLFPPRRRQHNPAPAISHLRSHKKQPAGRRQPNRPQTPGLERNPQLVEVYNVQYTSLVMSNI
jgi:hypothetical protein